MFQRKPASSGPTTPKPKPVRTRPRFRISASTKRMLIALLVLVVIVIVLFGFSPFWINWLWFGSVGYRSILITNYVSESLFFVVGGLIAAAVFVLNVWFALRTTREGQVQREGFVGRSSQHLIQFLAFGGGVVVFLVAGKIASNHWRAAMLAFRGGDFGVKDPTFHMDAGFYVFRLPLLHDLHSYLLRLGLVTLIAVAVVYIVRFGVRFRNLGKMPWAALRHLSALGCFLLLVIAGGYLLRNYDLVFSTRGVVLGPGFTDVNIVRPLNWLMALLSAGAGIALLFGVVHRTPKWLIGLLGGWALLAFIVTPLLPLGVQRLIVDPNEFRREEKYIERNIQMTRAGFGLDQVTTQSVTGQDPITTAQLPVDKPPLSNVRIWDYRVVQPIYQQLQTFVPYYEFGDIDVDEYVINGQQVQVLISARELNVQGLPANSQTWTNVHLAYTHGYGAVVSPVSQVSGDGWPTFLVSNIPPTGPKELTITQPEIYFGEQKTDWIVVHTDQTEFNGINDATQGATPGYQGKAKGSIGLGNPVTRLLSALTFKDQKLFISGQLTGDSRLILDRSILDRAKKIAPFFTFDSDPYLVIADGRLQWIIDGYTHSSNFPNATEFDGDNYMRNSVKVVVDAYDGTTTFYRTGEKDPIADAYGKIYKDLFTPISEAPASLAAHFRYPELQFNKQSAVWASYHVDTARSFYDGDDRWSVAQEQIDGKQYQIEPYFVSLPLPGEKAQSFALTVPFTPGGSQNRQNMTAWFAGTADAEGVTNLRLYRYPRQVTVFGPQQIEARISQDPQISQQLSLWNQSGADVIRGNMLIVPVNDAMLYVQPIYLKAVSSGAGSPRLASVIVATKDKVVMRSTLPEAVTALGDPSSQSVGQIQNVPAQAAPPATTSPSGSAAATPAPVSQTAPATGSGTVAGEALSAYNEAQAAMTRGDWEAYGKAQARLGQLLEQLTGPPNSATPASTPAVPATPKP